MLLIIVRQTVVENCDRQSTSLCGFESPLIVKCVRARTSVCDKAGQNARL